MVLTPGGMGKNVVILESLQVRRVTLSTKCLQLYMDAKFPMFTKICITEFNEFAGKAGR